MDRKMIEQKVKAILEEIIDVEALEDGDLYNDDIRDLGVNSTAILSLILNMEEEFNIKLDDDDFDFKHFETFKCLVAFVLEKKGVGGVQ